jgi:superoxide dismutase, Cu-Zn family
MPIKCQFKKMKFFHIIACLFLILLTSCAGLPNKPSEIKAQAKIEGNGITGTLQAIQADKGFVWVAVDLKGDPKIIKPGLHGVHIHEKGECVAEGEKPFKSAGGHFDPGPKGDTFPVENNHPYHLGDLPNIKIDPIGKGRMETFISSVSLADNPLTLFDTDKSAVIIHKLEDKRKSSGTADEAGGGRLACGIIELLN